MTKPKPIAKMTKKELEKELNGIEQHIQELGVGRYELNYREQLLAEIDRRGYEVQTGTRVYQLG